MTNPTTPFGWQMPTSTDLVTDLPADFETFGQAVATSMADLLGGTTGQVLAKASNTDMDFSWVAQDDSNAIQNAIVDAKGDLIAASAADTPARLAVGANGETLVADSSTSTGLRYQSNFAAGKNAIINGAFNVNQRAFSSSTGAFNYVFDRFAAYYVSGTTTASVQAFTPGAAPVAGYEATNFARLAVTGQTGGIAQCVFFQNIEDVRTFAGQTITVSFYAKANTGTPKIGVGVSQAFGSGGSPSATVFTGGGSATLSTSFARYSLTFAVPSISGKTIGTTANTSYLQLTLVMSDAANTYGTSVGTQNATFDIWGIQAEAGSVATAFQTATGTLQGELAACQRYYYQITDGATFQPVATALYLTNSQIVIPFDFKQTMRAKPTLIASSGSTYYYVEINGNADYFNSLTLLGATASAGTVSNSTEASGSASTSAVFGISNAAASVAFSAEL